VIDWWYSTHHVEGSWRRSCQSWLETLAKVSQLRCLFVEYKILVKEHIFAVGDCASGVMVQQRIDSPWDQMSIVRFLALPFRTIWHQPFASWFTAEVPINYGDCLVYSLVYMLLSTQLAILLGKWVNEWHRTSGIAAGCVQLEQN